jgi:hypothetical protein
MTATASNSPVSRRDVMLGAAGLGMVAPIAFAAPAAARAQNEEDKTDYSGHPAVGVWIHTIPNSPYAAHKYQYTFVHGDGSYAAYNPWLPHYLDSLGLDVGDPKLPAFLFGVWRPTDARTSEVVARVAWGDTSSTLLMTFWGRTEAGEDGTMGTMQFRSTIVDATGEVVYEDEGTSTATRFQWEPFAAAGAPEGTPST